MTVWAAFEGECSLLGDFAACLALQLFMEQLQQSGAMANIDLALSARVRPGTAAGVNKKQASNV